VHVFVRELLAMQSRYAEGAPAGWADTDPELIRSRGAASGAGFSGVEPVVLPGGTVMVARY